MRITAIIKTNVGGDNRAIRMFMPTRFQDQLEDINGLVRLGLQLATRLSGLKREGKEGGCTENGGESTLLLSITIYNHRNSLLGLIDGSPTGQCVFNASLQLLIINYENVIFTRRFTRNT